MGPRKKNKSKPASSSLNENAVETNITGQKSSAVHVQDKLPRDTSYRRTERGETALEGRDERGLSSIRGAATADEKKIHVDALHVDILNNKDFDLKVLVEPTIEEHMTEKDIIEYGICGIMVNRS